MKRDVPSLFLAVTIITAQVLGPAGLWAAEQRGIRVEANRQIVVSALNGDQFTLQRESGASPLQFREVLAEGARVSTGAGTTAELLIGNRAVVTLGHGTTAQVRTVSADQTTIQVTYGTVRVAVASSAIGSQGLVTVQTPTSQVQTRGGIVRVLVETPVSKAEPIPTDKAKAYRASYAPERVAAASSSGEFIHVDEGTAEILETGGKTVAIQAGQSAALQAGKVGGIGEGVKVDGMRPGVVAIGGHTQTPKEGRQYLVALQVDQAAQLGKALIGPAETAGKEESGKKSDTKNVINGATGGVALPNLVSALFGTGNPVNPGSSIPGDRSGAGYGGNNNNTFGTSTVSGVKVNRNDGNALLVFTTKHPVQAHVSNDRDIALPFATHNSVAGPRYFFGEETRTFKADQVCGANCLPSFFADAQKDRAVPVFDSDGVLIGFDVIFNPAGPYPTNLVYRPLSDTPIIPSSFTVAKELVLIGGVSNKAHGGVAPTEILIVRGAGVNNLATGGGLYPTDRLPAQISLFQPTPPGIVAANSTFVVESESDRGTHENSTGPSLVGGTLGQYSNAPGFTITSNPTHPEETVGGLAVDDLGGGISRIDGAITATGANVVLKGGVTLDQETTATIGTTAATDTYFKGLTTNLGRTFDGSLLSVIDGPDGRTSLSMSDRMLGVYDGSEIKIERDNKALLSVLDAKLKGPSGSIPLIDIAAGKHFTLGADIAPDGKRTVTESPGSPPSVTVTSALVTRSTLPLDGALLEASAPLIALTGINKDRTANMTTTSHFADLAGNRAQSVNLGDALVALNASKLVINSGHLLNLNNATAAIGGYLFSLTNGSQLDIKNGTLFSLNNGSSLTLNANAFGVFGSGANTLSIDNNLCGAGATCGALVNSANQPLSLNGVPLRVAGVTENIVVPNNFNVFAGNAATTTVQIDANDALFKVDGTSTLTINGTKVH